MQIRTDAIHAKGESVASQKLRAMHFLRATRASKRMHWTSAIHRSSSDSKNNGKTHKKMECNELLVWAYDRSN